MAFFLGWLCSLADRFVFGKARVKAFVRMFEYLRSWRYLFGVVVVGVVVEVTLGVSWTLRAATSRRMTSLFVIRSSDLFLRILLIFDLPGLVLVMVKLIRAAFVSWK